MHFVKKQRTVFSMLAALMLSITASSSAWATSFAVLLDTKGGDDGKKAVEKAVRFAPTGTLLNATIALISPRNSYTVLTMDSERSEQMMRDHLTRSGEKVIVGKRADLVLQQLERRQPHALELAEVLDRIVKIDSYFPRRPANELQSDYFNILSLSGDRLRDARVMKRQTRSLSRTPTAAQFRLALSKHKALLGGLTEIDSGPLKGSACGVIYCSCWGAGDCNNGIAACYTIHSGLQEGDPDPWTCDSYDDDGQCVAGSCRLI